MGHMDSQRGVMDGVVDQVSGEQGLNPLLAMETHGGLELVKPLLKPLT